MGRKTKIAIFPDIQISFPFNRTPVSKDSSFEMREKTEKHLT
jgi:hypothetical protein